MRTSSLASALAGLLAVAIGSTVAAVETFEYTVDRVEIDGNTFGPRDGVADLVDEFDDGMLAPLWAVSSGNVSESGGLFRFASPGLPFAIPGLLPVYIESSSAGSTFHLQAGMGDALVRAVLPVQALGANDAFHLELNTFQGTSIYYAGVALTNFNRALGDAFHPPYPVGFAATAHLDQISGVGGQEIIGDHATLASRPVSGPIVLELRYDDTARAVTPAVSLDGGATFATTFGPLHVETDSGSIGVRIGGAGYQGECPAGLGVRQAVFGRLGGPAGKQRLKLRLLVPINILGGVHLATRLMVTDDGAGGATVYDITLPDGLTAFQHPCGPRDGWIARGYVNRSNALPPGCVPGSAQGFQKLTGRWNGSADLKVQVKDASLPAVVGPVRVTLFSGPPANDCDGFVGQATCTAKGSTVRCRQ